MHTYNKPFIYSIRVDGHLPERAMRWFEGYTVTQIDENSTAISGVMDQAALHGLLNRIRDLGMELISVEMSRG